MGKMLFKITCMFGLLALVMTVDASRQIRSPGGAGWQGNGYDGGAVFSARSSPGGYGSLGRSSGWGGLRSRTGGSGDWQASGRSLGFNSGWDSSNSRAGNYDTYSSGW